MIFDKIYIDEDGQGRDRSVRADYDSPFDGLLGRVVTAHVHHELAAR